LNPQDKDPQRIKKADRKMVEKLNYEGIEFPVRIKDVKRIEKQNNIRISVFGHSGNKRFFPIYVSSKNYNDHMELWYALRLTELRYALRLTESKQCQCRREIHS
jgi:hypothetical protein